MKHTPTPWKVYQAEGLPFIYIDHEHDAESKYIAHMQLGSDDTRKANAAHIVKCVNLHDELVTMLDKVESCYQDGESVPLVEIDELLQRAKATP